MKKMLYAVISVCLLTGCGMFLQDEASKALTKIAEFYDNSADNLEDVDDAELIIKALEDYSEGSIALYEELLAIEELKTEDDLSEKYPEEYEAAEAAAERFADELTNLESKATEIDFTDDQFVRLMQVLTEIGEAEF